MADEEKPVEETPEDEPEESPELPDEESIEQEAPEEPEAPKKPEKTIGLARKLVVVVLLAIVVALVAIMLYSRTAAYQARIRLRSSVTATRVNALDKLEKMEEENVREVLPMVARALADEQVPVRSKAANLMMTLGDSPPAAIDELVKLLRDADVPADNKSLIIQTLPALGESSRRSSSALLEIAMSSQPAAIRTSALQAANSVAPDAAEVVDAVFAMFSDDDAQVRTAAADIAGAGARQNDAILNRIKDEMKEEDITVRLAAVRAMQTLGTVNDRALPSIVAALEDPDPAVALAALNALNAALTTQANIQKIREASRAISSQARGLLDERISEAEERLRQQ